MSLHHPDGKTIQAFVDGELLPADADRVQAHCGRCEACATLRDELSALADLLRTDATERPLRPVWPHVRDSLRPRVRLDLSFAIGAGLAVTAGLLLGVAVGTTTQATDTSTVTASTGSSASSTVTDVMSWSSWGATLPDVYGLTESEGTGS